MVFWLILSIFSKEIKPILHNLFKKLEKVEIFNNSFHESSITLINQEKTSQEKKITDQYPHGHRCKNH